MTVSVFVTLRTRTDGILSAYTSEVVGTHSKGYPEILTNPLTGKTVKFYPELKLVEKE